MDEVEELRLNFLCKPKEDSGHLTDHRLVSTGQGPPRCLSQTLDDVAAVVLQMALEDG